MLSNGSAIDDWTSRSFAAASSRPAHRLTARSRPKPAPGAYSVLTGRSGQRPRLRANLTKPLKGLVRAEGLEPPRAFAQRILSPLRLPVPPRPHMFIFNGLGNQRRANFPKLPPNCHPQPWRTSLSAASMRSAASSCKPGITWLYRSIVIATDAWPARSLATFGWTPSRNRLVKWACRSP